MVRESVFERDLIEELKYKFPGALILKNDSSRIQGIPDRLILFRDDWAALEVKRSPTEPYRPNQEYYLDLMDRMSFATTVYPQNKEDVIHALQSKFGYI